VAAPVCPPLAVEAVPVPEVVLSLIPVVQTWLYTP